MNTDIDFVKEKIGLDNIIEISKDGIEYVRCPHCPISSGKFVSKEKHIGAQNKLTYFVAWIPSCFDIGFEITMVKIGNCKFRIKKPILYSQSLIGVDVLRNEYKSYGTKR